MSLSAHTHIHRGIHTCTEFVDLTYGTSGSNRFCVSNVCLEFGQSESCEVPCNAVALTCRCFPILVDVLCSVTFFS
uniref:Uncharacterized protein n=1 Tax=Arundo donax TaxID=35708 RepID=A0A0A9GUQ7_ARUDO